MNLRRDEDGKRRSIIDTCVRMNALGINQGTSGNISLRHGDGFLVTPTSLSYESLKAPDIVFVSMDGGALGRHRPSSEWRMHRAILTARSEIGCVLHVHSPYATILAIMEREIPPIHYMLALAGGTVRCAPYATFGTEELSRHAVAALEGRMACLLAHHGMVALGKTAPDALALAVEVEALARQYHGCLQIGNPPLLKEAEIRNVMRRFAQSAYGPSGVGGNDT